MNEGRELHGGRETVQETNPSAARRTERAAKVIDRFDGNAPPKNRGLEQGGLVAWIARSLARLRKWLAVRLLHILSRDSATCSMATPASRPGLSSGPATITPQARGMRLEF